MVGAHHVALQKLAVFVPMALWGETKAIPDEGASCLYTVLVRSLDWVGSFATRTLDAMMGNDAIGHERPLSQRL